jgi:cytosine/adenosine deaminase-related metal-dependent hydrolase
MKYVVYGENKVMTGDAIADAVIAYAAALGENGTTDIVAIPTCAADGQAIDVEVLLGPASQVMAEPAPDDELEPEDGTLIAEIERRTAEVGSTRFTAPASSYSGARRLHSDPPPGSDEPSS